MPILKRCPQHWSLLLRTMNSRYVIRWKGAPPRLPHQSSCTAIILHSIIVSRRKTSNIKKKKSNITSRKRLASPPLVMPCTCARRVHGPSSGERMRQHGLLGRASRPARDPSRGATCVTHATRRHHHTTPPRASRFWFWFWFCELVSMR